MVTVHHPISAWLEQKPFHQEHMLSTNSSKLLGASSSSGVLGIPADVGLMSIIRQSMSMRQLVLF